MDEKVCQDLILRYSCVDEYADTDATRDLGLEPPGKGMADDGRGPGVYAFPRA